MLYYVRVMEHIKVFEVMLLIMFNLLIFYRKLFKLSTCHSYFVRPFPYTWNLNYIRSNYISVRLDAPRTCSTPQQFVCAYPKRGACNSGFRLLLYIVFVCSIVYIMLSVFSFALFHISLCQGFLYLGMVYGDHM